MTTSVADTLYGRRGGGWLPQGYDPHATPTPPAPGSRARVVLDPAVLFHPETIAQTRARGMGVDPDDLAALWAGRARMARARRAAGARLDPIDVEALTRQETRP